LGWAAHPTDRRREGPDIGIGLGKIHRAGANAAGRGILSLAAAAGPVKTNCPAPVGASGLPEGKSDEAIPRAGEGHIHNSQPAFRNGPRGAKGALARPTLATDASDPDIGDPFPRAASLSRFALSQGMVAVCRAFVNLRHASGMPSP